MKKIFFLQFVLIGLIVFAFQPAMAGLASSGSGPAMGPGQGYDNLPLAARYGVSAALGRDNRAYHFTEDMNGPHGGNPEQSCEIGFSDRGLAIKDGAGRWGLSLSSWGYGKAQSLVAPAVPLATGNRVEYRRGPLTEWYVNGPLGLQQGFTLESRPTAGQPGENLRLCLNLAGGLTAGVDPDRRGVSLQRDNGQALARYAGLTVLDAKGREGQAWLEVEDGRLDIVVDDQGLSYPLVIDPFIQKAKLTASDGAAGDEFGYSVSVSGDTVVVGAPYDDSQHGSAYVFVKSSDGWADMTQTAKLTASDGADYDWFGFSVSIDGDAVVVGAWGDNGQRGSAYVFVKPGGGWTDMTQTAKLTASDGAANDSYGGSVSISGDTVAVGAVSDDSDRGSAYVFVKPSYGWADTTQTAKLTASDGVADDYLGSSVSISGDTVVVGAVGDDSNRGSAFVFVKPGGGWADTTQTAKLTASDGEGGDELGYSLSISGDTVVVGTPFDDSNQGSAYVFVKPSGGWADTTQTAMLTASDRVTNNWYGCSVSISGDTIVVGAYNNANLGTASGAAYVFVKPVDGWSTMTQTAKLTASDGAANDFFGFSVSMGEDCVAAGAYRDDDNGENSGSAYVFDFRKKVGLGFLDLLLTD